MKFFATVQKITEEEARSAVEIDYYNKSLRRCGIPKTQDYKRNKSLFFLDQLHNTNEK
jgi:hypothetical protein